MSTSADTIPYRISDDTRKKMMRIAILIDIIGFIPAMGDVINWLGWFIFTFWFKQYKVNFIQAVKKNPGKLALAIFGETIVETFLLFWPGLIMSVSSTVKESRKEDKKKFSSLASKNKENVQNRPSYQNRYKEFHDAPVSFNDSRKSSFTEE
jgi:hypothetical protein